MQTTAIIGMGNMGSQYARLISEGKIEGMTLAAVTRIRPERYEKLKDILPKDLPIYQSGEELFESYDRKDIFFDTLIIVTPHYSHEKFAVMAFERGMNVLTDKPAGVYSRQARNMMDAYLAAKEKNPSLLYGYVFHQRTFPLYQQIHDIVKSGKYGNVKRFSWVVTDWYRPNAYYDIVDWRGTWKMDGGGTLLNQCPHNLDLMQWIMGMPSEVMGFCSNGKYHPIEVEDDVTVYLKWENGATGTFIASTGEAAGVNHLEIALDDALILCDKGKLTISVLDKPESEYRAEKENVFIKPQLTTTELPVEAAVEPYAIVLNAFANGNPIADGDEGIKSLYISNAVYLSSWENRMVTIPTPGSEYEKEFEASFENWLKKCVK